MKKVIFIAISGLILFSGCDGKIKNKVKEVKQDLAVKKESQKENKRIEAINKKANSEISVINSKIKSNNKSLDKEMDDQIRKQLKAESEGKVNVLTGQRDNMWE